MDAPSIASNSTTNHGIYRVSFVPYLQYLGHSPYAPLKGRTGNSEQLQSQDEAVGAAVAEEELCGQVQLGR